jgi:hypothetical protein
MTILDRCYNIFDLREVAQRRLPFTRSAPVAT